MALTIVRSDRLHFAGDSITNLSVNNGWGLDPGGFVDQILGNWRPAAAGVETISSGGTILSSGNSISLQPVDTSLLTVSSYGIIGAKAADVAADVAAYITNANPQKVMLLVGINDADNGTDPTAFQTSYASILSQAVATIPALAGSIGCMSCFCNGELWSPGGSPWGLNAHDADIETINTKIAAAAAAASQPYIDIRTPLGIWLQTHNGTTPGAASGIVTADNVHPNAVGKTVMSTFAYQAITVGA